MSLTSPGQQAQARHDRRHCACDPVPERRHEETEIGMRTEVRTLEIGVGLGCPWDRDCQYEHGSVRHEGRVDSLGQSSGHS